MNVHMSRRGFIFGAAAFSIVRPEILMPIKSIELPEWCPGPVWPTPMSWAKVRPLDTSASVSAIEMQKILGELQTSGLSLLRSLVDENGHNYTGE